MTAAQTYVQTNCNQASIIFGLGREGWSTFQFLRAALPELEITLLDDQSIENMAPHWQEAAQHAHTRFQQTTTLSVTELPTRAVLYKTPGIPPTHPLLQQFAQDTYQHSSNTQLFFEIIAALQNLDKSITTIGVTGTKGKSTTSSLITAALSQSQYLPFLGGNIGKPPLDLLAEIESCPADKQAAAVLELSCHQLAELTASPHVAVVLNITPEHLDYYPTVWEYVAAKSGIVCWQHAHDFVITSTEFELPRALATLSAGKHISHQVATESPSASTITPAELRALLPNLPENLPAAPEPKVRCDQDSLLIDSQVVGSISVLQAELKLLGAHNLHNLLAAITVASVLDIPFETIHQGLRSFEPLAHRMQLVAEKNGVRFVNDSLATTPEAAAAAIASFADSPVILIAGGHDRHLDFAPLVDALLKHRAKGLVLFPPTGELISETLHKRHPGSLLSETQYKVQSMPEAVQVAARLAKPGDVVLLSPACASFGTFKDYQDRGEQFGAAVGQL